MALTFKGGVHVPHHKETSTVAIEDMPCGEFLYVPLLQHIGAPAKAVVKKGDTVKAGQVIASFDEGLCCNVHSPISGEVVDIEARNNFTGIGKKTEYVVIKNDFCNTLCDEVLPCNKEIDELTSDEVVEIVKKAGISGMGGASFPTHVKISSALGKAKTVIINCAECEPFITANHRLMLEQPQNIIDGVKILLRAFGVDEAIFAIEDNKKDAAKVLSSLTADDPRMSVKLLKTKYPQGDERQIIKAVKKIELKPGTLPVSAGCVIFNAETTSAIYKAYKEGIPAIKRIVTVAGDCITTPKNINVAIGTPIKDIIEFCGGFSKQPQSIISGGPMMGVAQWDEKSVVTKGTSALLFLSEEYGKKDATACIHCGKCVGVCPMRLTPNYLALFSKTQKFDMCEKYNVMSCVECGCCTFTCPANIPIVQYIRVAKGKVAEMKKKRQQ